MKVLILSCNNGGGHNTVARAVMSRFDELGITADIMDSVAFLSKSGSKLMSKGHAMLYRRAPQIMDKGMKHEEEVQAKLNRTSNVYLMCALGAPKLRKVIERGGYTAVITTHVFGALMITEVNRKYGLDIKCFNISTDYSCVVSLNETSMDGYIIPHKDLIPTFTQYGIPEERIIPSGIPVRGKCYTRRSKEDAKNMLYLPADKRVVLLMGGTMGAGPMEETALILSETLPEDCLLVVICAGNNKLRRRLHNLTGRNVRCLGFSKKLDILMDAAELIITKPGGLTSTEIGVKRLPAIFIDAVMGCETQNMEFFVSKGYSLRAGSAREAADACLKLLSDEATAKNMRSALEDTFPMDATINICDAVISSTRQ